MSRRARIPNLGGSRALVLHRPHQTVSAILRQLTAIGLEAEACWPEPPATILSADFVFFDSDLGFDAQFPWKPGAAPMPLIALIGSEAPGRIEWALSHQAHAHLLKPVGHAGVYSALLIARQGFDARRALAREVEELHGRAAERQAVVRAVMALSSGGIGDDQAYAQLRALAMNWRTTIEAAAARVNALKDGTQGARAGAPAHAPQSVRGGTA